MWDRHFRRLSEHILFFVLNRRTAHLRKDSPARVSGRLYLLRVSSSVPTCPAAISRKAVTVGLLLRTSSTSGVLPFSSWRARRAATNVRSKWFEIFPVQSSVVIRAILFAFFQEYLKWELDIFAVF
ncbi:hypothetical protein NEICINOT_04709 [Neisseria cinerea ATCC 14685]|uniref:Uncharacterized protein n=1 Tax=Neisseria cinerea ATCC 14685 TaxID=546262 RepID=D0W4W2_NEICI|nr:hypothetical protein NEICINOT_04709 [Neisseria cinerea ATCC 14685]